MSASSPELYTRAVFVVFAIASRQLERLLCTRVLFALLLSPATLMYKHAATCAGWLPADQQRLAARLCVACGQGKFHCANEAVHVGHASSQALACLTICLWRGARRPPSSIATCLAKPGPAVGFRHHDGESGAHCPTSVHRLLFRWEMSGDASQVSPPQDHCGMCRLHCASGAGRAP